MLSLTTMLPKAYKVLPSIACEAAKPATTNKVPKDNT